ncbi:MAG: 3-deoxy-7-phosphoheptulonate synthase [Clostridiaceae bacterium]|nr:3-deoxy-7-phosphoheptulonate synthase [Clostridiaceae bacterium]
MIIILKEGATKEQIVNVEKRLIQLGFTTHPIYGEVKTVIGAIGDKRDVNRNAIMLMEGVEEIVPIMLPYKLAGKELYKEPTIIKIAQDIEIGGPKLIIMAGPCAIEGETEFIEIAKKVKQGGAHILRGGAYKPRSSPYSFQGLEIEGLKILERARCETGLLIVTEVVDTRDVETIDRYVDIIQIGARNMQNFRLLKEVGNSNKPVLLKRGLASTITEWLMAAEYIMSEGNENVILCERGIRTYEPSTRNTMDISAIPVVKELSHLPIIADPSHATGHAKYVPALAKAAVAAGADGLILEVHQDPPNAMSDGEQSIRPDRFIDLLFEISKIAQAVGRSL